MTVLTQGEIEAAILATSDALEDLTRDHAVAADRAAQAEADYKLAYFRTFLAVKGQGVVLADEDGVPVRFPKPTEKVAEAYATTSAADLYVAYKLSAAAADAAKQALFTRRARLDSLRTLSANVRSLT